MISRYEQARYAAALGVRLGAHESLVRQHIQGGRTGAELTELGIRRAQRQARVFTDDDVLDLRARYAEGGVSHAQLAAAYGVASATIGELIRGITYREVS